MPPPIHPGQRRGADRFLPSDANFDESFDLGVTDSSCSSDPGEAEASKPDTVISASPAVPTTDGGAADASASPTVDDPAAAEKRKLQRKLEKRAQREAEKRLQEQKRAAQQSISRRQRTGPRGLKVRQELDRAAYASLGIAAALEAPRGNSSAVDPNAFLVLDLERRMYASPSKVIGGKVDLAQQHRMAKLLDRAAALGRSPGGGGGAGNSPSRELKRTSLRPLNQAVTASPRTFHGISLRDRDCRVDDGGGETSSDDSTETPAARRRRHEAADRQRAGDADAQSRAAVESRAANLGLFQAFMTRTPSPTQATGRGQTRDGREHRHVVNPLAASSRRPDDVTSPPRFVAEEFDGELYGVRLSQPSHSPFRHQASSPDPLSPGGPVFGSPPSRVPSSAIREVLERPIVEFSMSPGGGVGFMASPLNEPQQRHRQRHNKPLSESSSDGDDDAGRKQRRKGRHMKTTSPSPRNGKKKGGTPVVANPLFLRETPKRSQAMFDDDAPNGAVGSSSGQYYGVQLSSAAVSASWRAAEEERGTRDKAARFVDGPTLFRTLAS